MTAVNNVSLDITEGEIFGVLGPNGAGKTTIINMILGLIAQTSGKIAIRGKDNAEYKNEVKNLIGLMTQETIVEGYLTARQNIRLFCELYHVDRGEIDGRIGKALEDAGLTQFADKKAGLFSGGMQRRLALVNTMVHNPKILILDEPTVGLDVQNRVNMWDHIRKLKREGVTIILTTQYLEEADALCDRIAIIDHGVIKAIGTPSELKGIVGKGNVLEITARLNDVERISRALKSGFGLKLVVNGDRITSVLEKDTMKTFTGVVNMLSKEKLQVLAVSMHLPTMDDVFIKLTGASFRDTATGTQKSAFSEGWGKR